MKCIGDRDRRSHATTEAARVGVLVVLLVSLAAATALGWWLWPSQARVPGLAPSPGAERDSTGAGVLTPRDASRPAARSTNEGVTGEARAEAVDSEWITLRGSVVGGAGSEGIPGAVVAPPPTWLGPPTVTTDESGAFAMPVGPAAPPALVVTAPVGWMPAEQEIELSPAQRAGLEEIRVRLEPLPQGRFLLELVDGAVGEPLPWFEFTLDAPDSGTSTFRTNAMGRVVLEALNGTETLALLDWAHGANVPRPRLATLELLADSTEPRLEISTLVGPTYELELVGWPSGPRPELLGYLAQADSRSPIEDQAGVPAPVRWDSDRPWIRMPPLGVHFREDDASMGVLQLVLIARDPPLRGVAEVQTLVGRAPERVRIRLRSALRIEGKVTARDGTTIPDVRLHFLVETDDGPQGRVALTGALGAYALEGVPVETQAVHVTAFVEGYDQRTETLTPFASSETSVVRRDLILDRENASAFLAGRIEGAVDHLENSTVTVMNIEPPFAQPRTVQLVMDPSGEAGSFRVEGIPPGRYSVQVGGWNSIEFTPTQMEVSAPADDLRIQARERGKGAGEVLARCAGTEPVPGTAWLLRQGDAVAEAKRFYCGVRVWDGDLVRAGDLAVLAVTGHQPVVTEITPQFLQSGGPSRWIEAQGPQGWGALVCATASGDPVVGLELRAPGGELLGITDGAGLAILAVAVAPSTLEFAGQGWIVAGKTGAGTAVSTRPDCEWIDLKLERAPPSDG